MAYNGQGLFLYAFICLHLRFKKNQQMKKILLSLGTVLLITACNSKPEGYTIEGDIAGDLENGTQVFLRRVDDNNQPVDIDTTTVENGKYRFTGGLVAAPEMHYIFVDKVQGYTAFVLENGKIAITGQKDSLGYAIPSGTPQNELFTGYMEKSKTFNERGTSIQKDIQQARMEQNEASAASLIDEMNELQEEYKKFDLDYIKSNPSALISALLLERGLMSQTLPLSEIQTLYEALTPEIKETTAAQKLTKQIQAQTEKQEKEKNSAVGAKAPEFSGPTPTGGQLALSDVMGKVTLIDFWAAWCRPCRAENPNVVKAYKKYHEKGFNIIGVSLDRDAEAWKKAIVDDGLEWGQISNVAYFNDPIAKLYNVDAIPAAFLLDENGIIVAKDLRGPALEAKIGELLD